VYLIECSRIQIMMDVFCTFMDDEIYPIKFTKDHFVSYQGTPIDLERLIMSVFL